MPQLARHRPAHAAPPRRPARNRTAPRPLRRPTRRAVAGVAALAAGAASVLFGLQAAAAAAPKPVITALSTHKAAYWGGTTMTITGRNFTGASKVTFGTVTRAASMTLLDASHIRVTTPWHDYDKINVRVTTPGGTSSPNGSATLFSFVHPTLDTPIQGGQTAHQLQRVAAAVLARHKTPAGAKRSSSWTAAMGLAAVRRAQSWLGMPYSWAGGNGSGPTYGVCEHNGGDLDCNIKGFDCSGLTLYAWAPFKSLIHYTVSQKKYAGRFHPTLAQLVPGDLVLFSGEGHVAIYAGNGVMIESPMSGYTVRRSLLTDMIAWDGYAGTVRPLSTGRQGAVPYAAALGAKVSTSGGTVTIRGAHLGGTVSVTVGSVIVRSIVRRTDGAVTVRVPAHRAGSVAVTVSTPWGTSQRRSLTYVAPVTPPTPTPTPTPTPSPTGLPTTPPTTPSTAPTSSPTTASSRAPHYTRETVAAAAR